MPDLYSRLRSSKLNPSNSVEVISYFKQAIAGGKNWYIALLEAIGLWTAAEEVYNGRVYRYLIGGEAFDWLLLAERLCEAMDGFLPDGEKFSLLFYGKPPLNLTKERFSELIGRCKYHQYLNYFYGVTVEEALILAVRDEVRKERKALGFSKMHNTVDEVYRRIYGANKATLLKRFRQEKNYPQLGSISITKLKEFTYWLFKYRVKQCDKARVASDTKKALERLNNKGFSRRLVVNEQSVV
jgi:hypothetical protein